MQFLEFLREFKQNFKALYFEGSNFFGPNDTLQAIVERILFSRGNRLIYLDEKTNQICGIFTLTDLFNIYLKCL
jgi:hypothetical protein